MWILFIVAALFSSTASWAQTGFSNEGPTLSRKVRNLGMGNVGVALTGTADSSPFYNPAGLNDLEEGRFQFFSNTFELSSGSIGLIKDMKNLIDNINNETSDAGKTRALNQFIQNNSGEFQHFRVTMDLFNYTRKNFGVGLILEEKLDVSFRDQSFPHFDVRNLGDVAFFVAGSHDFWEKLLQIGATLRPTVRFSLDESDQQITFADALAQEPDDLGSQFSNIKTRHFGLAVDVGLKSNLAFPGFKENKVYEALKPEVGLTWQDMGGPSFGAAPGNEQSVSVGMSVHPKLWKLKNSLAIDLRDLNQEREFLSKLHFGVESVFPIVWKLAAGLRAGLSQGYFSGGLTVDLGLVKLDGAYYKEEIGRVTREAGNGRFAVSLSFNI